MSGEGKEVKRDRYQAFLESKHAKFSVNPELLEEAVNKATSSEIDEKERLIHGEVNEVYSVTTKSGEKVIVRISRNEKPRFEAEKWAIKQSRKARVLAPEVLMVDRITDGGKTLSFCIERRLDGEPLRTLVDEGKLSKDGSKPLVQEAGLMLARIHSVRTGGFGDLKPNGNGRNSSWEEYMLGWNGENRKYLEQSAKAIQLDPKVFNRALDILDQHRDTFSDVEPRLLHGDFGPDHIFVNNGSLSGIIDFENCRGGDPVHDFSWWSYFGKTRPPIEWLKDGYKKEGDLGTNYELRLNLGKIKLGLDLVWYYHHEQHGMGIDLAKRNLRQDLEYFKS